MGHRYIETMLSAAGRTLQERFGSRQAYARMERSGAAHDALGPREIAFLAERDSVYLASVTPDGWPYVQHRGGPTGFLKVLDPQTIAFADFSGNRQYISTGNFATNDRLAVFAMSYPDQARLKLIGNVQVMEPGADPELEARVQLPGYAAEVERFWVIRVLAFDWNCSQHITPRWSAEEIEAARTSAKRR
jgi:predicted pyridoxine 5'-phosphate oxidase superfamily flavin-nucleotide-binding protein